MLGADLILEKIVEEGSNDLMDNQSTGKSSSSTMNAANPPFYDMTPLILSPITELPDLEIVLSDKKDDSSRKTPEVALHDLKKVGAKMVASSDVVNNKTTVVLQEQDPKAPTKPKVSFFSAVDKWFFGPLPSKATTANKDETTISEPLVTTIDWLKEGREITKEVLSGFELSTNKPSVSPSSTAAAQIEERAKMTPRTQSSLETGPVLPFTRTSPLSKDREKTMEFLDEALKQREDCSFKSSEHDRTSQAAPGPLLADSTIPRHLILNRSHLGTEFDEGSCLTSLPSAVSRGPLSSRGNWKGDNDDVSGAYTLDMWGEIAEASAIVHRALKSIEQRNGGRTPSSEHLTSIDIHEDVEEALMVLSKHAARLGVAESDILKAMISRDETDGGESLFQDPSVLATELRQSQPRPDFDDEDTAKGDGDTATVDGTVNSMTIGEEILEAIKMYMAKK